jgi:predicted nuclease of restriction endonuclease-like (RecB) superfamily
MVQLYWQIGRLIVDRETRFGWGAGVISRLADDLHAAFPATRGFSRRSLHYMRALATDFPGDTFVEQPVANLPWGHVTVLLDGLDDNRLRNWYAAQAIDQGWSQSVLRHQVRTRIDRHRGQALTNFPRTLPSEQSELVRDLLKDPYVLSFVELEPGYREHDLQRALTQRIARFMIELGRGFSYLGEQYRLEVGGEEFFVDLLFYHIRLKRLFVVELKVDDFRPEYAGKMAFYLNAVDDLVRPPGDPPSIGLILCAGRNETVVEYALRTTTAPIAVAAYRVREALPAALREELPNPAELKAVVDEERQRVLAERFRAAPEAASKTGETA